MNKQLIYIEGKYYSIDKLNINLYNYDLVILFKRGIIEPVNKGYKFNFVGVVSIRNIAFTVLPKTVIDDSNLKIELTLKSLKKYSNNNSQLYDGIDYFNIEPDHPECSELAITEFLIHDFQENGLFRLEEDLYRVNGEGDINWDMTINNLFPLYNKNQPIYTDTINLVTVDDQNNITVAIHKWCLGYVSKKYSKFLISYPIHLAIDYEEDLNEIGPIRQLINYLQKHLSLIFSDREIRLIKSFIFLLNKKAGAVEDDLSLYGTKKYENIWEAICKLVVKDNYKAGLYFSNPIWNILDETYVSSGTLIPDITCEDPNTGNFYLFDAKYYSLKFINGISGEPGYKDILKQFQYQSHIEKKIEKPLSNAFLFPLNDDDFFMYKDSSKTKFSNEFMAVIGSVKYDLYTNKKIWVIICPFSKWQQMYIQHKSLTFSDIFWDG